MERPQLNSDMNLELTARLVRRSNGKPLHGPLLHVRLFDRDFFDDDYLGDAVPDDRGVVSFSITAGDFRDSFPDDKMPDLFFAIYHGDQVLHTSKVMENIYLQGIEHYEHGSGLVADLGTFLVDL